MHIAIFKGQSNYDSLRFHADQIGGALAGSGVRVTMLDLVDPACLARIDDLVRAPNPPGLFIGFNGVGAELRHGDVSLFERVDAHYASFMVDHPIYQWTRLTAPTARRMIPCFLDRAHVRYVHELIPADHFQFSAFLPPGANTLDPAGKPPPFSWGERDIPVLFTGTYRGAPVRDWQKTDSAVEQIINGTVDRMLDDDRVAAHDAMRATLGELGIEPTRHLLAKLARPLHTILHYCASVRRHVLLTVLCEAEVPVVVYGKGWGPLAAQHPTLDWRGEGSWRETLDLLPRAKIVLNTNNEFTEGGHERVFAAQAHGAAVVSDASTYYEQAYRAGVDICLFRWSELDDLGPHIRDLLASGETLEAMAHAGYVATRDHHTWAHRAFDVLRFWELAMLEQAR